MRYPRQERLQRTLMFEPQPRVSLPEAARQEAVAVLATLIAAVMVPRASYASVDTLADMQWSLKSALPCLPGQSLPQSSLPSVV